MEQFRTHTGEIVSGETLQSATNKVADWWAENARAIYTENAYASHVTEETKLANLEKGLEYAEQIRNGSHSGSFTIWQRIDTELTGECVAFLP